MAREIIFASEDNAEGLPLYFVAYRVDGTGYLIAGSLETYNASNWSQYANALTLDATSGNYYGDFSGPAGDYIVSIYGRTGSQPATTDEMLADNLLSAGTFGLPEAATDLSTQIALDASAFINPTEFAEQIVYKPFDNDNSAGTPKTIYAVVERELPEVITDDGKVLADYIELYLRNDATLGVTSINRQRDKINVSGRYGGAAKDHLIFAILDSDQGVWHVRAR